ncbi:plasmid partition protein [Streptococcus parasanguinis]|uniref:Plasmid partition protein n=1 Tax=Streptococcus parasanguinis TaxID=1318 RepID=A0A4Q5BIR0_STRPA|nr:FtsK/SpoIIIE domain-containing protein [Streptococcus parasanguinis]KAB5771708.1 plasmid partition protein [Bifidobacterium adolescentis]MSH49696.1 plasmid partition protein [Escherichia coli]MTS09934.1 plasmid partition protein [Streptococcus parasanguinis]MTS55285.1 plasmid partition protein [Streptococcus parasanguinis]RYS54780.1 plasmid partition protein [Streptococcus parasanguinis]
MATTYRKNAQNVYKLPLYAQFWIWWALVLTLAVLSLVVGLVVSIRIIQVVLWSLVAILTIWRAYALTGSVIKAGTIRQYVTQKSAEKAVTKSLLATMTVNRLQDTPHISVPSVRVGVSLPSHITVTVEKLAGMYDVDKLTEDINSSFRGKLGAYAVTSAMITTDGLYYKFVLEDVGTDKTWRPATFEDIKTEKYVIKLQKGLEVNLSERAHIAVWGKTGSKKTTVLFGIILQLFSMGADVRFIDGKDEFGSFKGFYPSDKIVSDIEPVFGQLDDILAIIKKRQKIMADEVQKRQKIGLKASEVGLRPVVLVADEIGSIVALMDSKQSKKFVADLTAIIQRGRSVGVSVIASTQDPSTDTLPQKIRQQFATKILLGSANSDTQRMAFGEVATAGNVEDFRGFYTCDGLTNQPLKFYVCDLYGQGFNELEVFKKAYEIGF